MFASTDADIAEVAAETAKKTQRKITSAAGTAEVFNETDGGGAKFTTYDGKVTSFVGVNDPIQSGPISGIAGQLYVVGDQRTKLNMYDGRFCYVKGDNPVTDEARTQAELVVRSDIKDWALSSDVKSIKESIEEQLAGKADATDVDALAMTVNTVSSDYLKLADKSELVSEIAKKTQARMMSGAGTAEVFNEADGGGVKFTAADGTTSFVGVNDPASTGSIAGIAGQLYVVKGGQKTKLNMYDGRFCYVKGDNPSDDAALSRREIAVAEDVDLVSSDMREAEGILQESLTNTRATLAYVSGDYLTS